MGIIQSNFRNQNEIQIFYEFLKWYTNVNIFIFWFRDLGLFFGYESDQTRHTFVGRAFSNLRLICADI